MTQNHWNTTRNKTHQDQLYRRSAPISSLSHAFIAWYSQNRHKQSSGLPSGVVIA